LICQLPYGLASVQMEISSSDELLTLVPDYPRELPSPVDAVLHSLNFPIGSPSLRSLVAEIHPREAVIIVNDITRHTPYDLMLPPLLEILDDCGLRKEQIVFMVATGAHRAHTEEQNRAVLGDEVVDRHEVLSHDADSSLRRVGRLSSGNVLYVNERVSRSDLVVATGVIGPHYFAGFSGGRKSILPGVAGRHTIEANHSLAIEVLETGTVCNMNVNKVHLEMQEAARLVDLKFILNVVLSSKDRIVRVVAGDPVQAWEHGVQLCRQIHDVPVGQRADLTLVSAGGFPRDMNFYQAQKALHYAEKATEDGGSIILVAQCSEGLGNPEFEACMKAAQTPDEVIRNARSRFVLGSHKAYAVAKTVKRNQVTLVSDLSETDTRCLFMRKEQDLESALESVRRDQREIRRMIVMPDGSRTRPHLCLTSV